MAALPYPERFHAAALFVDNHAQDANLSEESKLLLYALRQQAVVGPCNEPRPWGWNVVSNAKWQSWRQLGDMLPAEAMRLYVRTLEEELPDWLTPEVIAAWETENKAQNASAGEETERHAGATNGDAPQPQDNGRASFGSDGQASAATPLPTTKSRSVAEVVVEGSWVSPFISSERRPSPRYEQSLALAGNSMYIVGGSAGGRHLSDVWALNLENLTWHCVAPGGKDAPALAGHAAVTWNGNVLVIGGRTKQQNESVRAAKRTQSSSSSGVVDDDTMLPVRLLNTDTGTWSTLKTKPSPSGAPGPRGAHSASLINGKVYVFGGEDAKRRPLGELWALDVNSMEWHKPEVHGMPPTPRSGHTACAYRNRYIVYFGGGTVATCFDDMAVLDTQTMEWLEPAIEGQAPPPRAGHASAILGTILYVLGGGNNAKGCADMYALDLSQLGTGPVEWTLVGNTPPEAAIAAEGLGLMTVPMAGCLVSFGGYNGKYHNAVHVYRPEGFVVVKSGSQHAPTAAIPSTATATGVPGGAVPSPGAAPQAAANSGPLSSATPVAGGFPAGDAHGGTSPSRSIADALKEAAAAKEAAALEVSLMRRQLDSATVALSAAERTAAEAREALAAEQQRSMQLEVEVAELRQRLVAMGELERELARRRQTEPNQGGRGGLWGFISGADATDDRE